jgi:AcrR family transcriptional regulator
VPRRVPRAQETRERILSTALKLFAQRGYSVVGIEEIAEAAGMTKGAVYYWFADKDDLGRELQHALYDRLTTIALGSLSPEDDTVTNMRRCFDLYLDALSNLDEARFFLRDAWVIPVLDEAGRKDREAATEMICGILAAAIERGEIVSLDPDTLARILVAAWEEAMLHVLRTGDRTSAVAVIDHLIASLRAPAARASAVRTGAAATAKAVGRPRTARNTAAATKTPTKTPTKKGARR